MPRIRSFRVSRSSRLSTALLAAAIAAGGAALQHALAQDESNEPRQGAENRGSEPAPGPGAQSGAGSGSRQGRDEGGPNAGAGADDVFIPSEEIGADEEVTFPVDI